MSEYNLDTLDVDLTFENKDNIKTEVIELLDKTLPFIIPTYQPFFGSKIKIKGNNTGKIKVSKGYPLSGFKGAVLLGSKPEWNEKTGHKGGVWEFLILDEETLNNNDNLTITYHSLGINYFPLNYAKKVLKEIEEATKNVDWEIIFNKPDTYYPQDHKHPTSELTTWLEVTWWVNFIGKLVKQKHSNRGLTLEEASPELQDIWNLVYSLRDKYNNKLKEHDRDYNNPHEIDLAHFGLDKVKNYPLANSTTDIGNYYVTPKVVTDLLYNIEINKNKTRLIDLRDVNTPKVHGLKLPLVSIIDYRVSVTNSTTLDFYITNLNYKGVVIYGTISSTIDLNNLLLIDNDIKGKTINFYLKLFLTNYGLSSGYQTTIYGSLDKLTVSDDNLYLCSVKVNSNGIIEDSFTDNNCSLVSDFYIPKSTGVHYFYTDEELMTDSNFSSENNDISIYVKKDDVIKGKI